MEQRKLHDRQLAVYDSAEKALSCKFNFAIIKTVTTFVRWKALIRFANRKPIATAETTNWDCVLCGSLCGLSVKKKSANHDNSTSKKPVKNR